MERRRLQSVRAPHDPVRWDAALAEEVEDLRTLDGYIGEDEEESD